MSGYDNIKRGRQLILFDGMKRRGNLAPTDIDGFQEYGGKLFLYFEGKVAGTRIKDAQKEALTRICESYVDSKYFAWVLIFEHNTPVTEDVIAKDQYVIDVISSVYPEWRTPRSSEVIPKFELDSTGNITLLDAIIQIENWCYEHDVKIGK